MDITSKGVRVSVGVAAGAGWLVFIAITAHRIIDNHSEPWCQAVALASAVVAITATISLTLVSVLSSMYEAWTRGVAYGLEHRPPELKRGAVPTQKVRSLHSVT